MHVLVPAKNTSIAKSRLAILLSPNERAALALAMLRDVLTALSKVKAVHDVHVVTDDAVIRRIGNEFGAHTIEDKHMGDLNAALRQARSQLQRDGALNCAVLAADLPLVTARDLEILFDQHHDAPSVTTAPAHDEGGTNGLVLSPIDIIDFQFGPSSFEHHCEQAKIKNCKLEIVQNAGLEFDIDLPQDLNRLISITRGSNTAALISEMADPLTKRRHVLGRAS